MRYALIGSATLVAFASAMYACGSDADPPGGGASSSSSGKPSSASSTSGASSSTSGTSGASTSSGGQGDDDDDATSSSSSTTSTSGSPPVIADSGTVSNDAATAIPDSGPPLDASDPTVFDGAAGTQCLAGSVQETEPNDTDATANTIPGKTGSFCGRIFPANDTDFVKFTLPVDASEMSIGLQNAGNGIQLDGTVDGTAFTLAGADAGGSFPFKPGSTYSLKATALAGNTDYILGLTIKQSTPTLCEGSSVKEAEPNDSEATANKLDGKTGTFCGTINTTTDNDTLTFTLPDTATTLSMGFTTTSGGPGSFKILGTVDGKSFEIPRPAGADPAPFVKGKPYVLKLTSTAPNNSYIFRLTVTP